MLKVIASSTVALLLSGTAFAQESAGTMELQPQETPRLKRNTVEIRPGDLIVAAIPGVAAVGASFESYIGTQWAGVVTGTYIDVDLAGETLETARDETDAPLVTSGYGYSAGLGLRYYEDPIGDSVYGGAHLEYSEIDATWDYEDAAYTSAQYFVTPSVALGYRWVWPSGFLVRLGAGAGLPKTDTLEVNRVSALAQQEETGPEKIEDILDQQVTARLDFGLGWSF